MFVGIILSIILIFLTQRVFPTSSWCLLRRWTGDPPETLSGLTSNPLSSPRWDNIMAHVYIYIYIYAHVFYYIAQFDVVRITNPRKTPKIYYNIHP